MIETLPQPQDAMRRTALSIADLLNSRAEHVPNAVAITAPGRTPLTYGRLRAHVGDVVAMLDALGFGHDDAIALVLPNGPEMAVAFLAVAAYASCAPLNPAYRADEFDFYLSDLRARALIVQVGSDSPAIAVARARGIAVVELLPAAEGEAGIFVLKGDRVRPTGVPTFGEPDDVALILHTSGTTARPKIVPLTQRNICASASNIAAALSLDEGDRCLNIMPLFHIHGLIGALLASLTAGASVVCAPGFLASSFFEWMELFRPTWYTAVPTMHQAILADAGANREVIARVPLRFVRSSSAALPPRTLTELEAVFSTPVVEAYGMTEASHQMATNPLPPRLRKSGSVGVAAGVQIAIMNAGGALLPAGETGEIVIRGPGVTAGYRDNPDANQRAFTDGWFRTGDQGVLDTEGYLFINGRLKEIINRGGEKIAPREIDELLMQHAAVMQAVTFAVPDSQLGEDVAAAVVLRPGATATVRELRDWAAARLAHFKRPRRIVIVDEIPKGPTGKVQRIGLAERLGVDASTPSSEARQYAAPATPTECALAEVWVETLGTDDIGVDDDFSDLGGNSIHAAQVVARIGEVLGVELPLTAVFDAPSVRELARAVEQMVRGRGGADTDAASSPMIAIRREGSRLPVYFSHGQYRSGEETPLYCYTLAEHLGDDQPLYALRPMLTRALQQPDALERTARSQIAAMRRVQPAGPYLIAGYCAGAALAQEIAWQLRRQGEEVVLVQIEAATTDPRLRSMQRRVNRICSFARIGTAGRLRLLSLARRSMPPARGPAAARIRSLMRGLPQLAAALGKATSTRLNMQRALHDGHAAPTSAELAARGVQAENDAQAKRAYHQQLAAYVPRPWPGTLALLLPEDSSEEDRAEKLAAWRRVTPRVEAQFIPGGHSTCVTKHARDLAERLRGHFDAAQGVRASREAPPAAGAMRPAASDLPV